jgi:N-acetylglutamate synthase-like GNAT family acetyltransferase
MVIRPAVSADRDWIVGALVERWGSTTIVTRDRQFDASELEALVAVDATDEDAPERVGLLTYRIDREGLEVVTIDALRAGSGIGGGLLARATQTAWDAGAARVWLITTNDNLRAVTFYQRSGFRIVAVHRGAVDRARMLKPSIPLVAENGIELHDELELELILTPVGDDRVSTDAHRGHTPPMAR